MAGGSAWRDVRRRPGRRGDRLCGLSVARLHRALDAARFVLPAFTRVVPPAADVRGRDVSASSATPRAGDPTGRRSRHPPKARRILHHRRLPHPSGRRTPRRAMISRTAAAAAPPTSRSGTWRALPSVAREFSVPTTRSTPTTAAQSFFRSTASGADGSRCKLSSSRPNSATSRRSARSTSRSSSRSNRLARATTAAVSRRRWFTSILVRASLPPTSARSWAAKVISPLPASRSSMNRRNASFRHPRSPR